MDLRDRALYEALVETQDVNVVLLNYERMRKIKAQKSKNSNSPPTADRGGASIAPTLVKFHTKKRNPSVKSRQLTASASSSSSSDSLSTQNESVDRRRQLSAAMHGRRRQQVPQELNKSRPMAVGVGAEEEEVLWPDAFDGLAGDRDPPRMSDGSTAVSTDDIPIVIPTGVPVVGFQDFRRLLVSAGEPFGNGSEEETHEPIAVTNRPVLMAPSISDHVSAPRESSRSQRIPESDAPVNIQTSRSAVAGYRPRMHLISPPPAPQHEPKPSEPRRSEAPLPFEQKIHSYFACC